MPLEIDDDLLDDLDLPDVDDELEDQPAKPTAKPTTDDEPDEDPRVLAAVKKALAEAGIAPRAPEPEKKPTEDTPAHPGFTPEEIRDSSVKLTMEQMEQRADMIDDAMDEVREKCGDALSEDDYKSIKKQLRTLGLDALKTTVAQKSHVSYGQSLYGAKALERRSAKIRNGGGVPPIGAKGGAPRGGASTAKSSIEQKFEQMYSKPGEKLSKKDREALRGLGGDQ